MNATKKKAAGQLRSNLGCESTPVLSIAANMISVQLSNDAVSRSVNIALPIQSNSNKCLFQILSTTSPLDSTNVPRHSDFDTTVASVQP